MSSDYTGNAGSSQSPSPAPSPGSGPIVRQPSSGDALTASSVLQPAKTNADHIKYIQSSVRLSPPRLPASASSGYTSVTYGAFGGTVTPSGAGASYGPTTGTNFVIKCIVGGAVGTATFQTSVDGGNTYGGTQTTAASMTDATSGITLAFSGTLTSAGTAQFWSALTSVAAFANSGSVVRGAVDHNGFITGGRCTMIRESWRNGTTLSNGVASGYAQLTAVMSGAGATIATGARSFSTSSVNLFGPMALIQPGAAAGTKAFAGTTAFLTAAGASVEWVLETEISVPIVTPNADWYLGMSNTIDFTAVTDGCFLRKLSTDTNWKAVCMDNGTATVTDTGVAANISIVKVSIELHGSSTSIGTAFGSYVAIFTLNGVPTTITTNCPNRTSVALLAAVGGTGKATAATDEAEVSELVFVGNRV